MTRAYVRDGRIATVTRPLLRVDALLRHLTPATVNALAALAALAADDRATSRAKVPVRSGSLEVAG